jgi:glyoxylase-like metal-dependent hydrolase (beta-lactamase superfamily II)
MAPGAWIFENMPGGYRSMVVDAGDHLVVLEAPLSPAYAEVQKRLIGEIAPGKSVRYVVVTHPHGDHAGGLKTWAEAGVTIVAPQGAAIALRRQLVGRGLTRPAVIEEVEDRRTLGSGAGRVDLHAFSSSHAQAHLLAHLPASRLLFQGDMLYVPDRGGPPPAFRVVGDLFEQIRRRRLAVDTVVGVHGRPATLAEAERSLERGRREGWGL